VGTPVASYVAGLLPDARPLDSGKPRDEDTEDDQSADKSLINRRLSLHSQPCAAIAFLADGHLAERALNRASLLTANIRASRFSQRQRGTVKEAGYQEFQPRRSRPWRRPTAPARPSPLEAGWRRTRARAKSQLTSMSISIAAKVRARSARDRCRPRPTMRPHRRSHGGRDDGPGRRGPCIRR
jgi:hypothetical protein